MLLQLDGEYDIELGLLPGNALALEGSVLVTLTDKASGIRIQFGIPRLQASAFGMAITERARNAASPLAPDLPPPAEPVYGEPKPEDFDRAAQDGRADLEG